MYIYISLYITCIYIYIYIYIVFIMQNTKLQNIAVFLWLNATVAAFESIYHDIYWWDLLLFFAFYPVGRIYI